MIKSKKVTDHLVVSDFKAVRFMTAYEKLKVAKAWERFLRGRCSGNPEYAADGFPKCPAAWSACLYDHFHQHLGYIAHYDRHGFYEAQWRSPDDFIRNVEMLASNRTNSGPLHSGAWGVGVDYEDLGIWIVKVAKAYLGEARDRINEELKHSV